MDSGGAYSAWLTPVLLSKKARVVSTATSGKVVTCLISAVVQLMGRLHMELASSDAIRGRYCDLTRDWLPA
jgi:hypothetical protein